VALITGVAGAVLAVPVSDWAMEAHHVSSMEGGRACAAIGIFAPLAFLVGALGGFVLSMWMKGVGFVGYLKRQALSLLTIAALVLAVGGLGYATADHPPLADGKPLALEIEVRVPTKNRSLEELKAARFMIALVVSVSDRNYSNLRWDQARRTEEYMTVPAWAPLLSKNARWQITAHTEGESGQIFDVLLEASPPVGPAWSGWIRPRERFDHSPVAPAEEYQVRYRVVSFPPDPAWLPADEEQSKPESSALDFPINFCFVFRAASFLLSNNANDKE